jgi:hypothetical protein
VFNKGCSTRFACVNSNHSRIRKPTQCSGLNAAGQASYPERLVAKLDGVLSSTLEDPPVQFDQDNPLRATDLSVESHCPIVGNPRKGFIDPRPVSRSWSLSLLPAQQLQIVEDILRCRHVLD